MYLSETSAQVRNQFFASLARFHNKPALSGWTWLDTEVHAPKGAFMFGRSTDAGGNIEGLHDQTDSPASLLVDEVKSIQEGVLDALARCHTAFRLFVSSTGQANGGFYEICPAKAHLWKTFWVPSRDCPHVSTAGIEADRESLKDSVWRIKHDARVAL